MLVNFFDNRKFSIYYMITKKILKEIITELFEFYKPQKIEYVSLST